MRFASLFSGIGGMDIGLERAGWFSVAQVEIDDYALAVLARHWPGVRRFRDVRTIGTELRGLDLICGGFPCKNVSQAGKREGVDDGDESGLWRDMARIIRDNAPRNVLIENPSALLYPGRGFDSVALDLHRAGYHVEWDCIPASALGAPHIRDRVWIWASRDGLRHIPRSVTPSWAPWPTFSPVARSTASVRARVRALGLSCVPPIVTAIGVAAMSPVDDTPGEAIGYLVRDVWTSAGWPRAGTIDIGGVVRSREPIAKIVRVRGRHAAELPTPSATEYGSRGNGAGNNSEATRGRPSLWSMARSGTLPTPTTQDAENHGSPSQRRRRTPPLNVVVNLPTPTASDASGTARHTTTAEASHSGTTLVDAVRMLGPGEARASRMPDWTLPTPTAWDGRRPTHGDNRPDDGHRGISLPKDLGAFGGLPSPSFVEWMLGFPDGHSSIVGFETGGLPLFDIRQHT